jgi:hypothetical protein
MTCHLGSIALGVKLSAGARQVLHRRPAPDSGALGSLALESRITLRIQANVWQVPALRDLHRARKVACVTELAVHGVSWWFF